MPRHTPWILALCLVIVCSFAGGYLLTRQNPTSNPADVSTPTATATSQPPTVADATTEETARGLRIPTTPEPPLRIQAAKGMMCSFDATIYDLRIPPDQITRLDPDTLTNAAATPESFQKTLSALGTARPLYRTTLTTTLDEESYAKVSNAKPDANGNFPPEPSRGRGAATQPISATGATFDLIPRPGSPGTIELDIAVTASYLLDFTVPGTLNPALLRTSEMQLHRAVTPTKPFLLFNADASTLDPSGKAVILITRVVFGQPHFAGDDLTAPK